MRRHASVSPELHLHSTDAASISHADFGGASAGFAGAGAVCAAVLAVGDDALACTAWSGAGAGGRCVLPHARATTRIHDQCMRELYATKWIMSRLAIALLVLLGWQQVPDAASRRAPDPDVTYAVPVGTSPTLGPQNAKVTMVVAFDYACPFCRQCWSTIDQLRAKYGKDLRVVYKAFIVHPDRATAATYAACAAHHQGKWRAMTDLLWTKAYDARAFDQANIDALEREAGLDPALAQRDMAGVCRQEISADAALFRRLAVRATPTSFINGRAVEGAQDISVFSKVIDEELAEANAAIERGVRPEKFYEQEIVGKGVTQIR